MANRRQNFFSPDATRAKLMRKISALASPARVCVTSTIIMPSIWHTVSQYNFRSLFLFCTETRNASRLKLATSSKSMPFQVCNDNTVTLPPHTLLPEIQATLDTNPSKRTLLHPLHSPRSPPFGRHPATVAPVAARAQHLEVIGMVQIIA